MLTLKGAQADGNKIIKICNIPSVIEVKVNFDLSENFSEFDFKKS